MAPSLDSNTILVDPSLAPLWVKEKINNQYFLVAAVVVLVYHTITTLDKEVKYFWGARVNSVTVIYFANRYIGIFGAISALVWDAFGVTLQLQFFSLDVWNHWITIVSLDYILTTRVLALYSWARHLAYILKALLGLEAIAGLVLFIYTNLNRETIVVALGLEGPTVCKQNLQSLNTLGAISWSIPIVYGTILMALALYKAAEFWRISSGFKGLNLVKVLIVDQAIYFVLAALFCATNITSFELITTKSTLANALSAFGKPTFLCVMGSILLFNLKEAGERGLNLGTSYRVGSKPVSVIEFC